MTRDKKPHQQPTSVVNQSGQNQLIQVSHYPTNNNNKKEKINV